MPCFEKYSIIIEGKNSSQHIGVSYHGRLSKWQAYRHSKLQKKSIYNGSYDNEETAALASDTLARKLMANGEQGHKLNFPYDVTEVPEEVTKIWKVSIIRNLSDVRGN